MLLRHPGNIPNCPEAPAGAASTLPPGPRPGPAPAPKPTTAAWTTSLPRTGCAARLCPTCFSRVMTSARGGPRRLQPPGSARPPAPAGGGRKEAFSSCLRRGGFYLLHLRAGGADGPRSAEAGLAAAAAPQLEPAASGAGSWAAP